MLAGMRGGVTLAASLGCGSEAVKATARAVAQAMSRMRRVVRFDESLQLFMLFILLSRLCAACGLSRSEPNPDNKSSHRRWVDSARSVRPRRLAVRTEVGWIQSDCGKG